LLILLLLTIIVISVVYRILAIICEIVLKIRAIYLLDSITSKRDLLYMKYGDFERVVAEMFRRRNHRVEFSERFGEGEKGLVIDGTVYVQLRKDPLSGMINVEQAMKLAKSMWRDSIYRGMFITLGDFENITYRYCHKNVITCINGDRLLEMCLGVQSARKLPSPMRQQDSG
jgi:restriction system protein